MPAKKIDPEEHYRQEKRSTVKKKLAFAATIGVLILITNLFMMLRSDSKSQTGTSPADTRVLGQSAIISSDDKARIQRVQKQATELAQDITEQTEIYVEEVKEKTQKSLSDVVYNTTIRPLIERIESLPDDQQEYVKEQLCRPEEGVGP